MNWNLSRLDDLGQHTLVNLPPVRPAPGQNAQHYQGPARLVRSESDPPVTYSKAPLIVSATQLLHVATSFVDIKFQGLEYASAHLQV